MRSPTLLSERTHTTAAVALSMDGFHLSKAALAQFADPDAALARLALNDGLSAEIVVLSA